MAIKRSPAIKSASQDIKDLKIPAAALDVFKNTKLTNQNIVYTDKGKQMIEILKYGISLRHTMPTIRKAIFKSFRISISETTLLNWRRKLKEKND